jgi:hypothetical protein
VEVLICSEAEVIQLTYQVSMRISMGVSPDSLAGVKSRESRSLRLWCGIGGTAILRLQSAILCAENTSAKRYIGARTPSMKRISFGIWP